MIPDTLFDLALEYRRTKLWLKLWDRQIFAVRHSDGSIGWCVVMGKNGDHIALADYTETEGLRSIFRMQHAPGPLSDWEVQTISLSQDCVSVSFLNRANLRPLELDDTDAYLNRKGLRLRGAKQFPKFDRMRPQVMPWLLEDEADQRRLEEALRAALAVSQRLEQVSASDAGFADSLISGTEVPLLTPTDAGFAWQRIAVPELAAPEYPRGRIRDELALARLKKKRGKRAPWFARLFISPVPMANGEDTFIPLDELDAPPFFPWMLMIYDAKGLKPLGVVPCPEIDKYAAFLSEKIVSVIQECGLPASLQTDDERTYALLEDMAGQLGVKLSRAEPPEGFPEAMRSLRKRLSIMHDDEDEDWDDEDWDDEDWDDEDDEEPSEEDLEEMLRLADFLLSSRRLRREIPDEMLLGLSVLDCEGMLSAKTSQALKEELKRRNL